MAYVIHVRHRFHDTNHTSAPDSLATKALDVIYEQTVVIPLQRAWKRKDLAALRLKYICRDCRIRYESVYRCRYCTFKKTYFAQESYRLDLYLMDYCKNKMRR
jgi:hypothetical protein